MTESLPVPATARRLRPGDTIGLVAPAGPVPTSSLEAALGVLESWGISVVVFDTAHRQHDTLPYLADTDENRARDFQRAWADPSIAAVLAARGGYGTTRMLDHIDWPALRTCPAKVFAGSSDTTALHQAISTHLGVPTLFSPMPADQHFDGEAAEQLRLALFEPEQGRVLYRPDAEKLVGGSARGTTTGGNLSMLTASIDTPEYRQPAGAIAMLEDVGEDLYRLDRMITQLLRSGFFAGIVGIVLGSWARCGDPAAIRELMRERLAGLGVPILSNFGFGHLSGAVTVPLKVEAIVDADSGTLTMLESAVC